MGNFLRNFVKMCQTNLRKANANTENHMKPKWEKIMGERIHYNKGDYNGVLWRARVSGLN